MDLKTIMLNEVSQTENEKHPMISLICRSQKKNDDTNELIYKTETLIDLENKPPLLRQEGSREGIHWDLGTDMCPLLYLKEITNKSLLYRQGILFSAL